MGSINSAPTTGSTGSTTIGFGSLETMFLYDCRAGAIQILGPSFPNLRHLSVTWSRSEFDDEYPAFEPSREGEG